MKAREFARTHDVDPDWIAAMGDRDVVVLRPGQTGTYAEFPARVRRHYANGMYDITVSGGLVCVDGRDFIPA